MKFLVPIIFLTSCFGDNNSSINSNEISSLRTTKQLATTAAYDLSSYDEVFNLPNSLLEISALGYYKTRNSLLTVNDEQGIIFELSVNTGDIISKHRFARDGDYEGLEVIGDMAYVVNSNGTIYYYDLVLNETIKIVKTALNRTNDIEGISYDEVSNEILLSCKERAMGHSAKMKGKHVVRFDMSSDTIKAEAKILIKDKHLRKKLNEQISQLGLSKKSRQRMERRVEDFAPSGLAIHPISKELYILSSKGKMIVTVTPQNNIQHIYLLDSKIHRQPEGICFTEDGNLYISNEGAGLKAKIYIYNYKA